jgi:hypothetical protein
LILHAVRYEASDEVGRKFPMMKAVQLADMDSEFAPYRSYRSSTRCDYCDITEA